VTIVSSGEYRRAAFLIETLGGEGGRVHPTARSIRLWLCAFGVSNPSAR